jgi:hypothetical protein
MSHSFQGSIIAIAIAAVKHILVRGLLFAGYLFTISLFLLLMALLFAHHNGSIWKSPEGTTLSRSLSPTLSPTLSLSLLSSDLFLLGHSILFATAIQLLAVTVPFFTFEKHMNGKYVAFVHIGSILLADIILGVLSVYLLHRRCTFLQRIRLPKEREVLRWFCRRENMPAPPLWLK